MPPGLVGAEAAEAALTPVTPLANAIRTANATMALDRGLCIYATELVIVARYVPGAKFAGTTMEIVGDHVAVLIPVLTPVTTVTTPLRSVTGYAVATTGPATTIGPAE